MSSCYKTLPVPSRTWSRVKGPCSLFIDAGPKTNETVTIPLTGKVVSRSEIGHELAMLNKGNVLQHKNNSSNLTQKQRYALIAKGKWVNRTTWGSQSANGYTNPNIKNLQRVNYVSIPVDIGAAEPIIIKDLGNLVCGTIENPVTGAVFTQPQGDLCFPSSFSDVPGPITNLCWNDGIIPWYPKTRYTMSNSGDKFPINATLLSAAVIDPPILNVVSVSGTSISLSWQIPEAGLPITSFNIYQNFNLISTIIGTVDPVSNQIVLATTAVVSGLTDGKLYMFYVTAISNTRPVRTESLPSNIVTNSSQIFSVTGNPLQYTNENQLIIEFINSGTISFLVNALSFSLFCGGGGGGGGGGAFAGGGAGGGGGGGGISTVTTSSVIGVYTVTVGSGGAGGVATIGSGTNGSDGLTSYIFKGASTYCTASGGKGGSGGLNLSYVGANGGASGTPSSVGGLGATNSSLATTGTLGGGGGGGAYNNNSSGAPGSLNIPILNNTDFGSGGGGGLALQNGYPGQGGNSNAGSGGSPGQDGKTNTGGGGGGGQSGNGLGGSAYNGGSGGSGVVILTFTI
jgi:hypothetical protein